MKKLIYFLILVILVLLGFLICFIIEIHQIKVKLDPYYTLVPEKHSIISKIDYLKDLSKKSLDMQTYYANLLKNEMVPIDSIPQDTAHMYHVYYRNSLKDPTVDTTHAVLFEFPQIIKTLLKKYSPSDISDSNFWKDKGFFIYLSNYGATGRVINETNGHRTVFNQYQTSCILQLAQIDSNSTNVPYDWKVIKEAMFNFGDIRPPKKISNKECTPEYEKTNCN